MAKHFGFLFGFWAFFFFQFFCSELLWILNSIVQFRSVLTSSAVLPLPYLLKHFHNYWSFSLNTEHLSRWNTTFSMNYQVGFHSVHYRVCGDDHRGALVSSFWDSSWLCHPVPLVTNCVHLEENLAHHTQSHPSAPACISYFQKGLPENKISPKHQSHLLLPLSFSLYISSLAAFSAVIFLNCLIQPFTEKCWTAFSNVFFLKVMGVQSLTTEWIYKANSAASFPLLPRLNIQSIWNILPIIRLLTKAILMYSEANSR